MVYYDEEEKKVKAIDLRNFPFSTLGKKILKNLEEKDIKKIDEYISLNFWECDMNGNYRTKGEVDLFFEMRIHKKVLKILKIKKTKVEIIKILRNQINQKVEKIWSKDMIY